jgi:hypothetical protein
LNTSGEQFGHRTPAPLDGTGVSDGDGDNDGVEVGVAVIDFVGDDEEVSLGKGCRARLAALLAAIAVRRPPSARGAAVLCQRAAVAPAVGETSAACAHNNETNTVASMFCFLRHRLI